MRSAGLALGGAYVVLVLAFPERLVSTTWRPRRLQVDSYVEELNRQVEVLAEESIISEERADEYCAELKHLLEENDTAQAGLTWEALDRLSENLSHEAGQEAAEALKELGANAEAASVCEALADASAQVDEGQFEAAAAELAEHLRAAAETNAALRELLDRLAASQSGGECPEGAAASLTAEEMKQLAEALSQLSAEELQRLQALQDVQLISAEELAECLQRGACGQDALEAWLRKNGGACEEVGACLGMGDGDSASAMLLALQKGGSGGISRGPGHAALNLSGNTDEDGAAFEDNVIAPARLDFEKSQLVGMSLAAPTADENGAASSGGVLQSNAGADSSAVTRTVLPRHRAAVKNYFKRNPKRED
jgi:hypothetical protein